MLSCLSATCDVVDGCDRGCTISEAASTSMPGRSDGRDGLQAISFRASAGSSSDAAVARRRRTEARVAKVLFQWQGPTYKARCTAGCSATAWLQPTGIVQLE
jgi:hypothetical protein